MNVIRFKLTELFSWKKHPFFVMLSIVSLLFYGFFLFFRFRITPIIYLNIYYATFIAFVLTFSLYIIALKFINPSIESLSFHRWVMAVLSGVVFGLGIFIWLRSDQKFAIQVLVTAGKLVPWQVVTEQWLNEYKQYYPTITFAVISSITVALFSLSEFSLRRKKKNDLLVIAYGFLLISVTTNIFTTDFFQIPIGGESIFFWGGTEAYVTYRVSDTSVGFFEDLRVHGGFLYGPSPSRGNPVQDYLSSTGFYGTGLKLLQVITQIEPEAFLRITRTILGLMTASIITYFSLIIKRHIGFLASLTFSTLSAITYWFIGPSTHIIWFFPVLFIPILTGIVLYPKISSGKLSLKKFLFFIFIAEFLVFLRSYVYAPVLIFSATIPTFLIDLMDKKPLRDILRNGILICLVGFCALVSVLVIHFLQLSSYYGSFVESFDYISKRFIMRSHAGDTKSMSFTEIFYKWMNDVPLFYFPKQFFMKRPSREPIISSLNTLGNLHLVTFVILCVSGGNKFIKWKAEILRRKSSVILNIALTTMAALLASWSWFPALGHMANHFHMNGIMFLIPFGLLAYTSAACMIQQLADLVYYTVRKINL